MWDDEDYDPPSTDAKITDKWDGEDEDDDVKDAWDAESDEEKKDSSPGLEEDDDGKPKAQQVKKKKKLADILREKEERKAREAEELQKAKQRLKELTAEEKAAEKARIKKEQEEADLLLARQVFGLDEIDEKSEVDSLQPVEAAEFVAFREALAKKLKKYENSPHFLTFVDALVKNLCLKMDLDVVKKISTALSALEGEKRKEAKKAKKGAASKKKPSTKPKEEEQSLGQRDAGLYDAYDEMDDFM